MDHGAMQGMGNGATGAQAGSMAGMDHSAMNHGAGSMQGMDHSQMNRGAAGAAAGGMAGMTMPQGQSGTMTGMDHGSGTMPGMAGDQSMAGMDMGGMDMGAMNMRDFSKAPEVKKGPGVQTISAMPVDRTGDPGQGLENVGHRVLTYRDLMALDRNPDTRAPEREIKLHLTGNMERYMWGFDGEKLSENPDPITLLHGERVRVTLINDTMMGHPIHIHGHFFELVTGKGAYAPRKHTVLVQPGGTVSWDVTGEEGDWAFHCHMLYHMHAGMMRVVQVRKAGEAAA